MKTKFLLLAKKVYPSIINFFLFFDKDYNMGKSLDNIVFSLYKWMTFNVLCRKKSEISFAGLKYHPIFALLFRRIMRVNSPSSAGSKNRINPPEKRGGY